MSGESRPSIGTADRAYIRKLARRGMELRDIATCSGWSKTSVALVIRERDREYDRKSGVFVISDPGGLFHHGAQFTMLDLAHGLEQKVWAEGTRFRVYNASGDVREVLVEQGRAWDVNAHEVLTWKDGPHKYRWARGDDAEGMATAS